ncbi:metabotropic glutamate receptor 3-like [Babylonia areolata]|uniref:metabotropic glutamate receptor 3-like n=1 Tax=Babylonia areolata TaxID=304850 RepID=UPI003FD5E696
MTDLLIGSLIVDVKDFNVPEFDDWLVQRKVNNLRDPWYRSYWEKKFKCSLDSDTCNTSQILNKNDLLQDSVFTYGGYVTDSVFMIANAVSRVLRSTDCHNVKRSSARGCVTGPRLLKELKATCQKGYTGWVKMTPTGESTDRYYEIRQIRPESTVTIASINSHTVYTWPKNNTCQFIVPRTMGITTLMGLSLALLSILCLLACLYIFIFFQRHRTNRIIKASSIELSMFILFSICVGYMSVLSFMIEPNDISCKVTFVFWGISFSLIYGPLFVRALWVYRIFEASTASTKRPFLTGAKTQVFFCIIIVIVQVRAVPIVWPVLELGREISSQGEFVTTVFSQQCTETAVSSGFDLSVPVSHTKSPLHFPSVREKVHAQVGIFNSPQVRAPHAILAFKTRHLPHTFNESHFILICVCTTLIVFISFIPTYLTTIYELTKVQILAIILILNHTVAVTFLFIPKIYSVLYRGDLQLSTRTCTSTRLKLPKSRSTNSSSRPSSQETFIRKPPISLILQRLDMKLKKQFNQTLVKKHLLVLLFL